MARVRVLNLFLLVFRERIADVRLKPDENAVVFELITKEELVSKFL